MHSVCIIINAFTACIKKKLNIYPQLTVVKCASSSTDVGLLFKFLADHLKGKVADTKATACNPISKCISKNNKIKVRAQL